MKSTRRGQTRRSKYGNVKTEVDGILFDSMREANRYGELKLLQKARHIRSLEMQPVFDLDVNGQRICRYRGDFKYYDVAKKDWVIEDCKGVRTPAYVLKRKLVKAIYDIDIQEL